MADKSDISHDTVKRTVTSLIDNDFLVRYNIGVYQVTPDVIFKGGKKNRLNVLIEYSKETTKKAHEPNGLADQKEELQAIQTMMEQVKGSKLQPINEKLETMDKKIDHLQFQMDTVYNWVDGLDVDVKQLKKA